jgi:NitT/TauT family transport system ATP-binding protein
MAEPLLIEEPSPGPAGALWAKQLGHSFGALEVLGGLDVQVAEHEVLGIVGPSGCGKSTLLELLCGLREPDSGEIEIAGARASGERLARCAYMPQRDLLLPWFSAIDNAALALRNRGLGRRESRGRAAELFERFGLAGFEGARPFELSGGMRQRVAFLRTLISGKPVLLLDEPFASLDAITRGEMQEWLAGALVADPRTVVLVTHDVEEALYLSDRVAVMSSRPGRIVAELVPPIPRGPYRTATITAPRFAALRAQAMEILRKGAR